ncbi:hypothetical protein D3C80_971690 [compost metagenome]
MTPIILERFKHQQYNATFILYMWDSLQNKKKTEEVLPYFDKIFSFDKTDSEKIQRVSFRPLFYIDDYARMELDSNCSNSIELCFIGTVHSDRYDLLKEIRSQIESFGYKHYFFMFFPSPILFLYRKFKDVKFYKAKYKEFNFKSLSQKEIIKIIRKSKIVLDIHHPAQTGLTMRSIEMLGANRKLITTNPDIRQYDFYNENNILIIDRNKPEINKSFFETSYEKNEPSIRYKYSIEGWLKELFS